MWVPSTALCMDKALVSPADDAVSSCDPDVCAKHGGPKPKDKRRSHVHTVELKGLDPDDRVHGVATAVPKLLPGKNYRGTPKEYRRFHFPRTQAPQSHVHVKPGVKMYTF